MAPRSSLGRARPKASVQNVNGELWIAKFPSKDDFIDTGTWKMVNNDLKQKYRGGLKLNISVNDNSMDFYLALSVAPLFGIEESEAKKIIDKIK